MQRKPSSSDRKSASQSRPPIRSSAVCPRRGPVAERNGVPSGRGVTTTIGDRVDSGTTTGRGARLRASAVTSRGRCHRLGDQHAKLRDVVGLYDPLAHSVVPLVDENSQIHAWDGTQPGLPMKRGRAGTPRATVRLIEPRRASRRLHRSDPFTHRAAATRRGPQCGGRAMRRAPRRPEPAGRVLPQRA